MAQYENISINEKLLSIFKRLIYKPSISPGTKEL
jgi:hypothetical protein